MNNPNQRKSSALAQGVSVPPVSLHQRVVETVEAIVSRTEEKDCQQHAYFILTGLQGHIAAHRLVCLLSTLDPITFNDAMCLSGLSAKRFRQIFNSLRACGAIVPKIAVLDPSKEQQMARIHTRMESSAVTEWDDLRLTNHCDQHLRAECGEIVNPAVVALLCQEVSS